MDPIDKVQKQGGSVLDLGQFPGVIRTYPKVAANGEGNLDLKINYRRNNFECPRFDGHDFLGWLMKVQQFFEVVGTMEDKIEVVMIHLEGKALQWHQRLIKTKGSMKDLQWNEYIAEMRGRFHNDEFADPMADLVSLKQSSTVEEFYEEFEALLNLLNLSEDYALSIFLSNLHPDISKSIRLFHPKSLTHALSLAKQMETIISNPPRKPFIPCTRNTLASPVSTNMPSPMKTQSHVDPKMLPGLLPTPKYPITPYNRPPKPYTNYTKPNHLKPENNPSQSFKGPTREERDERRRKGLCM